MWWKMSHRNMSLKMNCTRIKYTAPVNDTAEQYGKGINNFVYCKGSIAVNTYGRIWFIVSIPYWVVRYWHTCHSIECAASYVMFSLYHYIPTIGQGYTCATDEMVLIFILILILTLTVCTCFFPLVLTVGCGLVIHKHILIQNWLNWIYWKRTTQ